MSIGDCFLERVPSIEFLGTVLSQDISDITLDVDRVMKSFLGQFNGLYHRFNFLDLTILVFLFQSYCMSFYGVEMWYDKVCSSSSYNRAAVTYHKAIKKICKMNNWESNHDACERSGKPIFRHLLAKRVYSFYKRLVSSSEVQLQYYFFTSYFARNVRNLFRNFYEINIDSYDFKAVFACIEYVQRNEERSHHVYVP